MTSKHKIFGITLIIFILLVAWVFLRPKQGISRELFEPRNIDSIHLYSAGQNKTIYSTKDIIKICQELKKLRIIKPDAINLNAGFIDLFFSLKNQTQPITIRIMYNGYNGIMIQANDLYYKNDSLNIVVLSFLDRS